MDKPAANRRFAEKLELSYPILSDPGKDVARAYGVLKLGLVASRVTFVIGKDGTIAHVDSDVNVKTHGADLVARLDELDVARV